MGSIRPVNRLFLFPIITSGCFLSAILIGLIGTWSQSLGYLPSIGADELSPDPWKQLLMHPGFRNSLTSTLISGYGAALLSLAITFLLISLSFHNRFWKLLQRTLAPLLSIPHAAFAIGFLFLISPSGWILRLLSPGLTGFEIPPDWQVARDAWGVSLMLVLVLKEVPFLVLMSLGALSHLDVDRSLSIGRSLGYNRPLVWLKIILPRLYPRIRLSLFAVLAYSLSVVDIAWIIGPTVPPTLSLQVFRWFNDPDLSLRLMGAAGATLILLLVAAGIGMLYLMEVLATLLIRHWIWSGKRKFRTLLPELLSNITVSGIVFSSLGAILVLGIWSFTWRWQFPDMLPGEWSLRFWQKGIMEVQEPVFTTLATGMAAAFIAIVLVIGCLENEVHLKHRGISVTTTGILWLTYLPLLIPQIAFLFGVQVFLAFFRLDGTWPSLVWSHLLFVIPYTFLSLGPTYRGYDQRFSDVALTLCGSPLRVFLRVKLPILMRPILFSFAVGFSVSVAQYLPTIFLGSGRFTTVTTEAVNLAVGSDRRIVAVYALCQLLTPLAVFSAALLIPRFYFRNRRDMQT